MPINVGGLGYVKPISVDETPFEALAVESLVSIIMNLLIRTCIN
jgi:hypothetical protein